MSQPVMLGNSHADHRSNVSASPTLEDASFTSSLHSWHSDSDPSWGISEERRGTSVRALLIQSGYVVDASALTAHLVHLIEEIMRLVMILDGKCDATGMWEMLRCAGQRIDAMWQATMSSQVTSWQEVVQANQSLTEARKLHMKECVLPHPPNAECVAPQEGGFSCTERLLVTDRGELLRSDAHHHADHSCTHSWNVQPDPCAGCTFVVQFAEEITHLEFCVNTMYKLSGGQIEDDDVRDVLGDALDMLASMDLRDAELLMVAARRLIAAQKSVSAAISEWNNLHVA